MRPRFNAEMKALYSNNMMSKPEGITPNGSKSCLNFFLVLRLVSKLILVNFISFSIGDILRTKAF